VTSTASESASVADAAAPAEKYVEAPDKGFALVPCSDMHASAKAEQ